MQRLQHDEYLAVALSRMHALNNPMISRLELFCFPRENNVYSYSVAMPLRLDYQLIDPINTVIVNLMEFGLIDKWIKLSEGPTLQSLVAKEKHNGAVRTRDPADGNVILTMDHIIGALVIMAFGYALALIAFLVEQLVFHRLQKGSESKFILNLHTFLRPYRIDCMVNQRL